LAVVALKSKVEIKPQVSCQVTFGEHMSLGFEVSWDRLLYLYDFVADEVFPKFRGLFS